MRVVGLEMSQPLQHRPRPSMHGDTHHFLDPRGKPASTTLHYKLQPQAKFKMLPLYASVPHRSPDQAPWTAAEEDLLQPQPPNW